MSSTASRGPAADAWAPYFPGRDAPWDLRRVVHLHCGAGFAATWDELQRDLEDGPGPAVDRVLAGKSRGRGVPGEVAGHAGRLARLAVAAGDLGRLKAWWAYRMLLGPDPLAERMTLFWHNHFATGAQKVGAAVYRQNEIFREFARAPFGELLRRVVKDPALLIWLDAPANRRKSPNENLARELMELFTLGIGHYSERDVREATRTLTGWGVSGGAFREVPDQHDGGEKTVLGRMGRWTGDVRAFVRRTVLDAYAAADRLNEAARAEGRRARYPATGLGADLRLAARLMKAGFGTRVYYARQATYDTHAAQLPAHERLLAELGGAVRAFLDDLTGAGLADRVAVLCFSEFGRRAAENGSYGTDHGTAGPVFLAGGRVKPGLVGATPASPTWRAAT